MTLVDHFLGFGKKKTTGNVCVRLYSYWINELEFYYQQGCARTTLLHKIFMLFMFETERIEKRISCV